MDNIKVTEDELRYTEAVPVIIYCIGKDESIWSPIKADLIEERVIPLKDNQPLVCFFTIEWLESGYKE